MTLFRKGLILLSIPLLTQAAYVGMAVWLRADIPDDGQPRVVTLLVATVAAGVLTTGLVAWLFWQGVARRLAAVTENTRRLAAGEELLPPLFGADEVARLDHAFRAMAGDLTKASDRLRESAARIHDLYDNAPCGYHSVTPDGTIIAINQTELHWIGYPAGEVIGRMRFADVLAPASQPVYWAAFDRLKVHGAVANVELELTRKDGTTFPVLAGSTAVRDAQGQYKSSRTTLVELTERKRAEDEIRRLNEELEQPVRDRTTELTEAIRELRHKNDENEMFVYSVSHDLRSPLVNLQGFSGELDKGCRALAEVLSDESTPPAIRQVGQDVLDGRMIKAAGFIRAAVTRLGTIIDALLRLSRAGRVEYRWQLVDVRRIVAGVVDAAQAQATDRAVQVAIGNLPPAWGDPTALEQAFANLIGNALTYLDPTRPGAIEVSSRDGMGDGMRTYYVRDNGLGIEPAHQAKIFQAFQRAHPGIAAGEGIGLAIVARVAERHRGKVWVESAAGAGSTFYLALQTGPNAANAVRGSGGQPWAITTS